MLLVSAVQPPYAGQRFQTLIHVSYASHTFQESLSQTAQQPSQFLSFVSVPLRGKGLLQPKNLPRDLKKEINMEKLHILKTVPSASEVLQSIAASSPFSHYLLLTTQTLSQQPPVWVILRFIRLVAYLASSSGFTTKEST